MQKGKVKKIKIFIEKGVPPQEPENAQCTVDLGLQGDRYAKGGQKQITMIDSCCVEWLKNQSQKGLCFERFKANIEVENLDASALKSGDILVCGDALLELSSAQKECFPECELAQKCIKCKLNSHAKYLKVLKSGTICVGDEIYSEL